MLLLLLLLSGHGRIFGKQDPVAVELELVEGKANRTVKVSAATAQSEHHDQIT